MDLISIIITTYKGTDGLLECVSAAINQDFLNFEVIVVDDNGVGTEEQKKTQEIIAPFLNKKNFFYIAHETNRNGSAARNTGIANAKGSYIAFLDDDDILHCDSIRLRYEKLTQMSNDYGIVFASYKQYIGQKEDMKCIFDFEGDILSDYLKQKINSPSSVIMIRKEVVDNIGYWDETFRRHQDWEFITRVLSKYKACSIPKITVDRIITCRNNAKKPELFEEQRLHYLSKMKTYIDILNPVDRREVYYCHYIDIGKNYLKYHRVKKAIIWAFKSRKPVKAFRCYIIDGLRYYHKQ